VGGTVNLTACGNRIITSGGGTGISLAVADDSALDPGARSAHLLANVTGNRIASANTANENIASLLNSSTLPSGLLSGGSILLTTAGTTTISGTTARFASNGFLTVKAASQTNLSGLNLGATVTQVPGTAFTTGSTTIGGTTTTGTSYTYDPPVPPPPYYNSSLNVPMP